MFTFVLQPLFKKQKATIFSFVSICIYVCTPVFLEARNQTWVSFFIILLTLFLEAWSLIAEVCQADD